MIESESFILEKDQGKNNKHNKRNDFLNHFQLNKRKWPAIFRITNPVGGNLQRILEQGNSPANKNDGYKAEVLAPAHFLKLQVAVPGERHEGVGQNEQNNGRESFHIAKISDGMNHRYYSPFSRSSNLTTWLLTAGMD